MIAVNPERRPVARLSRRWTIAAAHRLHTESFDAERNTAVYGKCNNPHGHGHNYVVEVAVRGAVDPEAGTVVDLVKLDRFAREEVLVRFDHQNLNLLPEFAERVPTTENFAHVLRDLFAGFDGAVVERVHVEETRNNSFDLLTTAGEQAPRVAQQR